VRSFSATGAWLIMRAGMQGSQPAVRTVGTVREASTVAGRRTLGALGTVAAAMLSWELARAALGNIAGEPASDAPSVVRSLIRAIVLLLLPVWVARTLLHERFSVAFQLGVPSVRGWRALVYGLGYLGFVAGFLYLLQGSLFTSPPTGLALGLLVVDVFVEEALCRGFLLTQLRRELTFARANAFAALAFLLAHSRMLFGIGSQGEYVGLALSAILAYLLGLSMGVVTRTAGCIWVSVLIHTANNLLGP
jgi:membrane protease YdiL (CAAX protease family)